MELLQHPAVPVVTFLLGLWLGHTLALWRDRRKEFNDAADPIRAWLLAQIDRPTTARTRPGLQELDRFRQHLHWWRRKGWDRAWAGQLAERDKQRRYDALGQGQYEDPDAVRQALRACLPFTAVR